MKTIAVTTAMLLIAFAAPAPASTQSTLVGRWVNPRHSVIVDVAHCGNAYCGTVSWASASNREKGTTPGTRVLTDLRRAGDGSYKGSAFDPKRNMHGSAIVRQIGPDVMVVKGCGVWGLVCKEQRWTRTA